MFKSANVGSADRLLRLSLGALLIALPLITSLELWTNPIALYGIPAIGVIMILTGLLRFCPAYVLIGANTCERKS